MILSEFRNGNRPKWHTGNSTPFWRKRGNRKACNCFILNSYRFFTPISSEVDSTLAMVAETNNVENELALESVDLPSMYDLAGGGCGELLLDGPGPLFLSGRQPAGHLSSLRYFLRGFLCTERRADSYIVICRHTDNPCRQGAINFVTPQNMVSTSFISFLSRCNTIFF